MDGSAKRPEVEILQAPRCDRLISQRYERGSTLITSNLPFDEWTETFGSSASPARCSTG